MSQLQKNSKFVYIPGKGAGNSSVTLRPGARLDKSESDLLPAEGRLAQCAESGGTPTEESPLTPQEQLILREEIIREYDALRQQYIAEGEKARLDAKEWASRLIETTENDIRKLYANNERDCEYLRHEADEKGYTEGNERGFSQGYSKGYSEGYAEAKGKCEGTLKELMTMLAELDGKKEQYFKDFEKKLFDAIFTIANKITVDSLKQKEKAVIQKMLREAAKGFRNSEYIKVTLSKIDVENMGTAGMDELREVFRENQHVEYEIVKDAPEGTLILDNGSEITDAGVHTQLKMIENLGKGKFREKAEDSE